MERETLDRFEKLNKIGASLSQETNIERLLENILIAAKVVTSADAGTIYRMHKKTSLRFAIVHNDSLNIAYGGASGAKVPQLFKNVPLYHEDGSPNNSAVAAYAALHEKTVNIANAYDASEFDFSSARRFDKSTGYRSESFLTVPMKNHEQEIIGVLQLINAKISNAQQFRPFSLEEQHFAESLASQAAIALTNRALINQLEVLFESFIRLINIAIDEKSPYTAGHCQRVPALTMMLADACVKQEKGPFADFFLSTIERYELKIASLMHDCGKISTPIYVVDKATKLETIFDRIALIDTRFEIALRDAKLGMFEAIENGIDPQLARNKFTVLKNNILADRAFCRACNAGQENMPVESITRLKHIAKTYEWQTMDGIKCDFLNEDELTNLSIRHGTLTRDERRTINQHIESSIRMLETLPWPKHLKRVPEYAGAHHERMDGKGYPNGLTGKEMSAPARMMAIADIFEALTAKDRPYKKTMKLSEALKILQQFSQNGHIDPDLYKIFIEEKVYLKYAQEFLDASQIDDA